MQFSRPLLQGQLIQRYKRFLADVKLADGSHVTAHCANTGAMTGCAEAGWQVWMSKHDNPKRKLAYSWELSVNPAGDFIGINTLRANQLVSEAIRTQVISELTGYTDIRQEVTYGNEGSRADFVLSAPGRADCYVEVKSVTLLEGQQGYFPDTVTKRGQKHLRELSSMLQQGKRCVLLFCVQHSGIQSVAVAAHIDPAYAQALAEARAAGLEVVVYGCAISPEKILINQPLQFIC